MRRLTARFAAALIALGLLPVAANAAAGEPDGLTFTPALAGPGDLVTVRTTACGAAASAVVYAKSLGGTVMLGPALQPGRAEGSFRVFTSAEPGTYVVRGVCANGTHIAGVLRVPKSWVGQGAR
jgi:hypothetical protein